MINQCHSCGGFCKKSGCERENVKPTPKRKPLTDEECIDKMLRAGFERNSLGWTFTYGRLDYHLLKFARSIEAAHNIKK